MARPRKNKRTETNQELGLTPTSSAAKREAAPTLDDRIVLTGIFKITKENGFVITKQVDRLLKLPISRSQMAYELAECSFAIIEEIAFKAGIHFLPDAAVEIDNGKPSDENF